MKAGPNWPGVRIRYRSRKLSFAFQAATAVSALAIHARIGGPGQLLPFKVAAEFPVSGRSRTVRSTASMRTKSAKRASSVTLRQ
jgi:hypothetical protein